MNAVPRIGFRCVTWRISAIVTLILTLEVHHVITLCQAFVIVRNTIVAAHRL